MPYNSHVVLDSGFIITKPIASQGEPRLIVMGPDTLLEACPATIVPEPSISSLSA